MFRRERERKEFYFNSVHASCSRLSPELDKDFHKKMREASDNYYNDPRTTPYKIKNLKDNEIFVFGSNLAGLHEGGAARIARQQFGAIMGQGVGLQGKSYAIPTMQGGVDTIKPYVDEFIEFAKSNPDMKFLVTRIGCGVAGFKDSDIAPLFAEAKDIENIALPKTFWDVLAVHH